MATRKKDNPYKGMSFGDLLVTSTAEAAEIEAGRTSPARAKNYVVTAREVSVSPPPEYKGETIRRLRDRLNISQSVFAKTLNVSLGTVRSWEQGIRTPDGPSLRLLQVVESHPKTILSASLNSASERKPYVRKKKPHHGA